MYSFMSTQPAATTVPPAIPNSTFTFTPSTMSQPWNPFGTSSTPQTSVFGTGMQSTSTVRPFGNPPTSTAPINFTPTNLTGTSIFGTNQVAPVAPLPSPFGSNLNGTTFKFGPVSSQASLSTASTTSNIFGIKNTTTTTTANLFGPTTSTVFSTSVGLFNQSGPTATAASTNLFTIPASSTPATNIFAPATTTITNPFRITTSTAPVTTSIFGLPTTTNPFDVKSSITPSPSNFVTNTNTSTASIFTSQPFATTNIFSQSTGTTPFNTTAATTTINPFNISFPSTTTTTVAPTFPPFQPVTSTSGASNIFNFPVTSTTIPVPVVTNCTTQPTVPTTTSFSFASSATSILNTTAPTTTTTPSIFNPLLFTGLSTAQTQPAVTLSTSTILSPAPKQAQNTEESSSIIQQRFLAASLLDPYANRGKKDFTNTDQIQIPTESAVVSTLSTTITTNTTTITASAPIPITLPLQSNSRKVSSSRSVVDINFKLKPISSSPTLTDDIKPSNQQPIISTGPKKSSLAGNFTDEEELILLGRTKMSKLRLSNDIIHPSYQPDSIRSLYPLRNLTELEKLPNQTPPSSLSSSPTTAITNNNQRTVRDISPSHHSTSSINLHQSSSPIIQRKSPNFNSQTNHLPILTGDNYYMKPNLSELKSLFNNKGQCILKQFTVGHEIYGSVTFYGEINVAGLNLDEIVEINRHEVIVYPDDNNKPSVGEELNLPARITLLGIYPTDRTTRQEITDIERIKAMNYKDYLCEMTKKFDGEFINYEIMDGAWTFMVKHFTRYGLDNNQNDFVVIS